MNRLEAQLIFWRVVARELGVGVPLLVALQQGRKRVADSVLEKPLQSLISLVNGGQTLSAAMQQCGAAFTRTQVAIVHAGEIGGVLDICIKRMVDEMAEGGLLLSPSLRPTAQQQASFWWAFGCMLSSGVPILDAIDVAGENISDPALKDAVAKVHAGVRDGKSLSQAMRPFGSVFSESTLQAIDAAEERGEVDVIAMRLGDELVAAHDQRDPAGAHSGAQAEPMESDDARKIVNLILLQSVKDHATDIHFEPDEGTGRLRYRIDGALYEMVPPPPGMYQAMVNRVKIMANLDIAETRLPQTGRILMSVNEGQVDVRVSTIPVFSGERLVMRILRRDGALVDLGAICDGEQQKLERMRQLIGRSQGLVICTGSAGSGKTTLLYSMLQELNRPEISILTVEDPVELSIKGLGQVQISPQTGLTMAAALRHVLRQDPDVMMVGEVRDLETLQACTMAASIGHLVLTTLHTNTAVGEIQRMLELKLEPHLLNSALTGVVAQRLVRRICPKCRKAVAPPLDSLPTSAADAVRAMSEPTFYSAGRCEACHGTGYTGRMAVHEILICNDEVRAAIRAGAEREHVQRAATAGGMTPLSMDALSKAAQGQTSVEELLQVLAVTST